MVILGARVLLGAAEQGTAKGVEMDFIGIEQHDDASCGVFSRYIKTET